MTVLADRFHVASFDFTVPGPPVGKERPRFTRQGRTYTPQRTVISEDTIRAAWAAAGSVRLPDQAVNLTVEIHVTRPKSHFRVNGELSAEGRRNPIPTSRPDVDNISKLLQDALNGLAWRDDAQIADLHVTRRWASEPAVRVTAWDLVADLCSGEEAA